MIFLRFPAVLWNCMQPSELWILNPRKLLAKFDQQKSPETELSQVDGVPITTGLWPSWLSPFCTNRKCELAGKGTEDDEAFLDKRECWICYDCERNEPLIQPCDCTGDVSSVHHECLRRWLMESSSASNEPLRCKVCNYEYEIYQNNELKWDKAFTAKHWGSTAVIVTCICMTVACAWIVIQLYDNSYIRMLAASVALIVIYICIR